MPFQKEQTTSLAIFCKVVDNYGDIGICWRLSRQLQQEHGIDVTLWVDDLQSFRRICPEIATNAEVQQVTGITVRHWRSQEGVFSTNDIADIVIEFFACDIPPGYIDAMAQCDPRPVWLNLEGLTAEEWVEGCHTLPSPHPRLPLTKHFFFPGFTGKTGGLLHEASLEKERIRFQSDPAAVEAFLAKLGLTSSEIASFKTSLFCYPHAPVKDLFDAWQNANVPVTCLVPEGVAAKAVQAFMGMDANMDTKPGTVCTRGALTVRILPFVTQPDYDRLLWACDFNLVRGEDSFVRAQWACRPFIWHIYPQDEDLHHKKLKAFLQRYAIGMNSLIDFSLRWNGTAYGSEEDKAGWVELWALFQADLPKISHRCREWEEQMLSNGDLTSNLLKFAGSIRSLTAENKV